MSTTDSNNLDPSSAGKEDGLKQLSRLPENNKRIKNVQDKFVNSQNLLKDGRALVGEGILMKVCRKKPKQRAFFLFNDILVYGRVVISGRKYSQQKIIPLKEIQIGETIDSAENPYAWLIRSPKKSFIVRANSDRERQEWLTHLQRCIRYASGGNNMSATAALWLPDDKADICMHCNSTKFSAYNRRHHCRNCGLVVCDGCSRKRFLLLHLDSKAVRVCDGCYSKLNNTNTPTNDSRPTQRDRTADSSDSDGDDSTQPDSPIPTTFYHTNENLS